jgi:excisionase family DNA binding protein
MLDDNGNQMTSDRLAYRVPEVCRMLGISRATFYRRVGSGEMSIKKLGGVSLVTRESLVRMFDNDTVEFLEREARHDDRMGD